MATLLKDLLKLGQPVNIEARTFGPDGEDLLYGNCRWDGEKLISLDGDSYYIDEVVEKYEFAEDGSLIYWFHSDWS